jgi:integrase
MVRVGVASAFRPSELLALRWRDLDVAERLFPIRETIYRGELRPYTKATEPDERDSALLTAPVPDDLVQARVLPRTETEGGSERGSELSTKNEATRVRHITICKGCRCGNMEHERPEVPVDG